MEKSHVKDNRRMGMFFALILMVGMLFPMQTLAAQDADRRQPELYQAINKTDPARVRAAINNGADVNAVYDRDTMLCWALRSNDPEIIRQILQSANVDVNKRGVKYDGFGEWERTPLILAAHMGQTEAVGMLLHRGAKVNAKDRTDSTPEARGNTALIKAAQRDHTDVIRLLLTQGKGIEVDAQTKEGNTPLWFVVEYANLEATKLLHDHGAGINHPDNSGQSMLTGTFLHNQYNVLDYLIANGADINMVDNGGNTPLMTAINSLGGDNAKLVFRFLEKFLTYKPTLDLQKIKPSGGGHSALHLAAHHGFADAAKLLLDNGASINIQDLATGGTPLHSAAGANQITCAKLLIERKANTEIFDKTGSTPLILAVFHAHADMVKILADAGAAINTKSPVNVLVTPLVYAASNPDPFKNKDNLTIIAYLLSKKGDINFPSANGRTALMAAAARSDHSQGYERGALLIKNGANLESTNDKGETALMLATGAGNEKLVKLLIDKGADVNKKNGAGESVMAYANRSGNQDNTALLASKGVTQETAVIKKGVVDAALFGTWKGFQDGLPYALYTVVLNKNGQFNFNSRFTPEALKSYPAGSVKAIIAEQKGTYTCNNDIMIWNITGAAPTSMKWKLENGMLIIDDKIRLKKNQ